MIPGVRNTGQRINRYLFAPTAPELLGYCRFAFCLWLFLFYLPLGDGYHAQGIRAFANVGDVFWQPVFPFNRFGNLLLPNAGLLLVETLWKALLLMSCLGIFTRFSLVGAFLLSFYVIGLPYNFGKISHSGAAIVFILGILALSKCGDSFSIDAKKKTGRFIPSGLESGEYRWPIRFVWIFVSLVYLLCALSKLKSLGFAYLDSEVLAGFLRHKKFAWLSEPYGDLGYVLAQYPLVCSLMALLTLIFEGFFFFTLFSGRARGLFVPVMFCFHIGVAMVLGPRFFHFMAMYVFFVPWDRIVGRLKRPVLEMQ